MPSEWVWEVSNIHHIQRDAKEMRIKVTVSDSIHVDGSTEKKTLPYNTYNIPLQHTLRLGT